ncbi:MAG: Methyltransferase type 11 [Deltaproteobacteria bacterium]|nr:Methyltransferase type 11 [Deltaproteobacteria bacterium]
MTGEKGGGMEERKQKEIEHSDRRRSIVKAYEYSTDAGGKPDGRYVLGEEEYDRHFSNMKFYSVTRSSMAWRDSLLFEKVAGAVALDYCCGNGEVAVEMARRGAKRVIGIDISDVAVRNATELAKAEGVGEICEFRVMDAERTDFPDDTFDVIHEYGALHHLDLEAAFRELSRILKPDGKLVCTEALRHNPLIRLYRKRTPHLRTEWEAEHILGFPEIRSGAAWFGGVAIRTFHLAALAAVPFRNTSLFRPLLSVLETIDDLLLSIPYIRRFAWVAVVRYDKPGMNSR